MDFQGIIQRLRPYAPYLLKDGGGALYSDILEWLDTETTKPTEAECLAEWDVMLAERAADQAERDLVANTENNAITKYSQLPEWAKTGTAEDAEIYINENILNGQSEAEINAWIDANVTNIASAKAALKQIASALVAMRTLFILVTKLLLFIRDLVIRFRKIQIEEARVASGSNQN